MQCHLPRLHELASIWWKIQFEYQLISSRITLYTFKFTVYTNLWWVFSFILREKGSFEMCFSSNFNSTKSEPCWCELSERRLVDDTALFCSYSRSPAHSNVWSQLGWGNPSRILKLVCSWYEALPLLILNVKFLRVCPLLLSACMSDIRNSLAS